MSGSESEPDTNGMPGFHPDGPQPPAGGWLELEFPDRFRLEFESDGEWMEWGTYERRHVVEVDGEENVWLAAAGGMPIYFRCVERRQGEFDSIAGTGERITYRLVDLEDAQ